MSLVSRRAVLGGAVGGLVSLTAAGWLVDREWEHSVPALAQPSRVIFARAAQPLLIDPNLGDPVEVVMPHARLGAVPSSTVLPLSMLSKAASASPSGPWDRVIYVRQPLSGPVVDPHLLATGRVVIWGRRGPGSTDVVTLRSDDGRAWSVHGWSSHRRSEPVSLLERASPSGGLDPFGGPGLILAWTAADSGPGAQPPLGAGSLAGSDYSGSGNPLIVNPGETLTAQSDGGVRSVLCRPGRSGVGCTFAGGVADQWSVLAAVAPGPSTSSDDPLLLLRRPPGVVGPRSFHLDHMGGRLVFGLVSGGGFMPPKALVATGLGPSFRFESAGDIRAPDGPAAGIDLPSGYRLSGLLVYAARLSDDELAAFGARLAGVAFSSG